MEGGITGRRPSGERTGCHAFEDKEHRRAAALQRASFDCLLRDAPFVQGDPLVCVRFTDPGCIFPLQPKRIQRNVRMSTGHAADLTVANGSETALQIVKIFMWADAACRRPGARLQSLPHSRVHVHLAAHSFICLMIGWRSCPFGVSSYSTVTGTVG